MVTPKNPSQPGMPRAKLTRYCDSVSTGSVKKKRLPAIRPQSLAKSAVRDAAMVKVFPANYREIVRVFPWRSKEWSVELYPDEQPFLFPTKGQAISFALAWADYHQPCEVRVFDGTGELQRDIKVPDGNYRRMIAADRRREQVEIDFTDRRNRERRS